MARGRKQKKNRGGKPDGMVMPFHSVITGSFTTGTFVVDANPTGLGARVLADADAWALFKLHALKFRIMRSAASIVTIQAVGYVGSVQDTPPATVSAVTELIPSTLLGATVTIPSAWVVVPPSDLAGEFPWYKTIPGTPDPSEEKPGQIVLAGTSTDTFVLEVKGVIRFKTSVSTGNTPAELEALAVLRKARAERERALARRSLLGVLAPTVPK